MKQNEKRSAVVLTGLTAFLMAAGMKLAGAASLDGGGAAKLLLENGRIHTPEGVVQAMAVNHQGVIIAVGPSSNLEKYRTDATRVIDLENRVVLPGFHDVHVHPLYAGLSETECRIPQGSTLEATQQRVKACVVKAAPGAWITGGQWDAPALGRAPTREMLDAVVPDHPVLLLDTSAHSSWVNTKALEAAGITRQTPDPEGGIIERDAAGNPTGVLRESAVELVRRHVPAPTEAQVRSAIEWSLEEMLSHGITSFTEAAVGFSADLEKELSAYAALADAGKVKQRSRLCLTWEPGRESSEAAIAARNLYARSRVSPDCVKIFLDGVPTDSHTAAMLEPYAGKIEGRDDEASRKGLLLVNQAVLNEAVTRFDRMGLTVKFHAAGDAAVRAGLNAIEAARKSNGFSGQLHDVGHCTFVAKGDIARARALGASFEVSPYLWAPSPINDSIASAIGDDRMERVWPVREMIEAGALVVPGSDWAVVPSVNPWIAIEILITRERPGGSKDSFGKAEAISLEQAIALFTVNSARHMGQQDQVGRIAPGMLADVIVLDRDPYATSVRDMHKTAVLKTIINGEIVYERSR